MKIKRRTVRTIFLFSIILLVPTLSALSLTEKVGFCDNYQFSLSGCLDFWDSVDNLSSTYNISLDTLSQNKTEYVYLTNQTNQTCEPQIFYREANQTNSTCENSLSQIDDYKKRGFEPVFENGLISNWKKIDNKTSSSVDLSKYILSTECESKVSEIRSQYVNNKPSSDSSGSFLYYLLSFLAGVVVCYIYMKKKSPSQLPLSYSPQEEFYSPQQIPGKSKMPGVSGGSTLSPSDTSKEGFQ